MTVEITWHSHACLEFNYNGAKILIDPFITGNPAAQISTDEVTADYILVSHGHGDHVGDAVAIAKRTGALVTANHEIAGWLAAQGVEKTHGQHIGGSFTYPWGKLKLTIAHHGSQLPDGSYGGNPCGFLLYMDDKKFYDAADTGLFYDMKLIGEEGIDVAFLPIGDNFTMGPEDALRAVKLINPKFVVPIHYNTFDLLNQDVDAWKRDVESQTDTKVIILQPEEKLTA